MTKFKFWLTRYSFAPIAVLGATFFSNIAYAQTPPTVTNSQQLGGVLCNVTNWMIYILIAVSILYIVYAAFLYVTGGDDAEKISSARKTITWAAVGVAVALLAASVPTLVSGITGGSITYSCSLLTGAPAGAASSQAPYGPNSD